MLNNRNYTAEVLYDDSKTKSVIKMDGNALYYTTIQNNFDTTETIVFYDKKSQNCKCYRRSDSDRWSRDKAGISTLNSLDGVLNVLWLYFYYPEIFTESNGAYVAEEGNYSYHIAIDGKDIKTIYTYTYSTSGYSSYGSTQTRTVYFSDIGKTKVDLSDVQKSK